ncbi:hypothetical protein BDZ88DRAFT_442808 [Geranomyces variabilis]|nr:hypothetical protein BDZ88DRAFT_442808 [Geranomyces variabilis]
MTCFSNNGGEKRLLAIIKEEVRIRRERRKKARLQGLHRTEESDSEYDTEEEVFLTMDYCLHNDDDETEENFKARQKRFTNFRKMRSKQYMFAKIVHHRLNVSKVKERVNLRVRIKSE